MLDSHKLTMIFQGEALDKGEIDVADLAPALLAFGEMLQACNRVINNDKSQISVKVRAVSRGSFEVDLHLVQSLLEQAASIFEQLSDDSNKLQSVAEWLELLLCFTATCLGLFELIKRIRNRKIIKTKELSGGKIEIHVQGDVFVTETKTFSLAQDMEVRRNLEKIARTAEGNDIESITWLDGKNGKSSEIKRDEVQYFCVPPIDEHLIYDKEKEMNLQIIRLSFKEKNKWQVTDGGDSFGVDIIDNDFLNKITLNEISFSKGDYLICRVSERQFSGAEGLRIERTIVEVKEHIKAMQQLRLF